MPGIASNKKLKTGINADDRKKLFWGIILSIALTCLIFAAIEIRYPFFFTTDDNADWYASEYANVIRVILNGRFPLYNFTQFCGQRFFANGQSGVLNPVMYLAASLSYLIFKDLHATVECLALLMMILGSAGAFLLLKRLGANQAVAVAGAIAWNFNAYNVWVGVSWILVIITTGVLPFIFYGSVRLCDKPSFGNYLWAILPKVFLFYVSHPQFFFYAALYDCIFAGTYTLIGNKGARLKSTLKIIGRYVLVYIAVIILILPQLIPQYQMIAMTRHGGALSFEEFNNEGDGFLIGFLWPFICLVKISGAIDPYIGYPLLLFLIEGLIIPILLLSSDKDLILKHKQQLTGIAAATPCIIIAGLSTYSLLFKHLLYLIPMVNRFHFLHRNNVYLGPMMVIAASLSCTLLCRFFNDKLEPKKRVKANTARILGVVFVILEVVSMAGVYIYMPHWSRGPVYEVEEGYDTVFASRLKDMRYVCIGYENDFTKKQNLSHSLRYNLSSYYGISNVSGYYGVYTTAGLGKNLAFFNMIRYYSGDLPEPYPGFVDEMRGQSVCWYVLNPENRSLFENILTGNGMEKVFEDEHSVIYHDSKCEPLAYDDQGRMVSLEQGEVNYLKLTTDDSFSGGTVTLNYSYDSNFHCYIDGTETRLTDDNDNWQMKFDCPSGKHDILIRYEDHIFTSSCMISGSFALITLTAYAIYRICRKKKASGNNQ